MSEPEHREPGYRGPQVCKIVGITYRQLDYWARTELVRPSVMDANGSGTQRLYSYRDLVELKVIKQMLDAGISLQSARKAVESLRAFDEDLASIRIVIQGPTIVLAQSDEQVMDLLRGGQGVLSVVLDIQPLQQTITEAVQLALNIDPDPHDARPRAEELRERVIDDEVLPHEQVRFAHNSERQFAKLLDFYGIVWEYEPTTFTLERDRDGRPVQAFTPDFYLPAYDLYIEITTLNQKLVTKKNRKARRLVEQHPEISIRVLYQRDYLHLLVKYGLELPSQLVEAGLDPNAEPPVPFYRSAARPASPCRTTPPPRAHEPGRSRMSDGSRCGTVPSTRSIARSARAWCRSADGTCRCNIRAACSRSIARAGPAQSCSTCRTWARSSAAGSVRSSCCSGCSRTTCARSNRAARSTRTSSTPTTPTWSTTSSCGGSTSTGSS